MNCGEKSSKQGRFFVYMLDIANYKIVGHF